MARDERAQQVVQDLMQQYGRDNHLVWSTEKSAFLRRGGEGGMVLDVRDGVAWLERGEKAVVLQHVQPMGAEGTGCETRYSGDSVRCWWSTGITICQ